MPLGDSLTQGSREYGSYRRHLWRQLEAARYGVVFVGRERAYHPNAAPEPDFNPHHEGHWGWRSAQVAQQIHAWSRLNRPDIVLLWLGTNDAFAAIPPEATIAGLAAIVDALPYDDTAPDILVGLVPPVDESAIEARPASPINPRIDRLNAAIAAFVEERVAGGAPLHLVDLHTDFDPAADTYDGVHFTAEACEVIAARWFDALAPVIEARRARRLPRRIRCATLPQT